MSSTPDTDQFNGDSAAARVCLAAPAVSIAEPERQRVRTEGVLVGTNSADGCNVYQMPGARFFVENGERMVPVKLIVRASSCTVYLTEPGNSTYLHGPDADCPVDVPLVQAVGKALELLAPDHLERVMIGTKVIHRSPTADAVELGVRIMFADFSDDDELVDSLHTVAQPLLVREAAGMNLFDTIKFNSMDLQVKFGASGWTDAPQIPTCPRAARVVAMAFGAYVAAAGNECLPGARVSGKTYTLFRATETKWHLEANGKTVTTVTIDDEGEYNDHNGDSIEDEETPTIAGATWGTAADGTGIFAKRPRSM